MAQVLTATQDQIIRIKSIKDRKGNEASVQDPVWESSDPNVLTVTQVDPADFKVAKASAVGPVGASLASFKADADLGEGIVPIIMSEGYTVIAGQAVAVEFEVDAPTEQV